jgi:hypothetical protein
MPPQIPRPGAATDNTERNWRKELKQVLHFRFSFEPRFPEVDSLSFSLRLSVLRHVMYTIVDRYDNERETWSKSTVEVEALRLDMLILPCWTIAHLYLLQSLAKRLFVFFIFMFIDSSSLCMISEKATLAKLFVTIPVQRDFISLTISSGSFWWMSFVPTCSKMSSGFFSCKSRLHIMLHISNRCSRKCLY